MKRLFALWVVVIVLLIPVDGVWAKIERIDCATSNCMCNGVPTLRPGGSAGYFIQGPGVDLATGVSMSNSALSATIQQRWNGAQNQADGGNILWGKIKVGITASASAPAGNHILYIKYLVGQDSKTVTVIPKAGVTGYSPTNFPEAFQSNVDVTLTGTNLNNATGVQATIKRDAFTPLLDSGGQEAPSGVSVTAALDTATNTATMARVRLNFSQRLTQATVEIKLTSNNSCASLCGGWTAYTVLLKAPVTGPNYVKDHLFNPTTLSYMPGTTVTVTIRLERSVPLRATRGEPVYWAVIPSSAIQQAGSTGTPYDPSARYNTITIAAGQQSKTINFQIKGCPGAGKTNTVRFITWKPDPNVDTSPNRKETTFTIVCP